MRIISLYSAELIPAPCRRNPHGPYSSVSDSERGHGADAPLPCPIVTKRQVVAQLALIRFPPSVRREVIFLHGNAPMRRSFSSAQKILSMSRSSLSLRPGAPFPAQFQPPRDVSRLYAMRLDLANRLQFDAMLHYRMYRASRQTCSIRCVSTCGVFSPSIAHLADSISPF